MKVLVTKTNDWDFEEIREYKDLNECCKTLLTTEDFYGSSPELVVSFTDNEECEYEVEIYNSYRE